jgi:type II secretory pathway pseudopilin PulG
MNTLSRTIIVFVAVSLMPAGFCLAQNVPDKETQDARAAGKEAELAAKIAEQQAQAAQQQVQAAQQQMETAQRQAEVEKTQALVAALAAPRPTNAPEVPVAPSVPAPAATAPARVALPSFSVNSPWPLGAGGTGAVLVIPAAEIKTEDLVTVTEDMSVMSRIFEKNLEQARIATTRGGLFVAGTHELSMFLGGGRGAIQSMYLQGYGALFLMRVDFPLSAPPEVKEEEKQAEEKEQGDPVWDQMRRDMYEPQEATRRRAEQPEEKYDAEKVENLKATLVKALKHAANIRSLKSDESVILTVAGSGEAVSDTKALTTRATIAINGHKRYAQQLPSGGSSQTLLVIRAKKSDIDNFAGGTVDAEQFRQRVRILTCPYIGAGSGLGDPFNPYYHLQQEVAY